MYNTIFLAKTNHFKYTERLQSHLKNRNNNYMFNQLFSPQKNSCSIILQVYGTTS